MPLPRVPAGLGMAGDLTSAGRIGASSWWRRARTWQGPPVELDRLFGKAPLADAWRGTRYGPRRE